MSDEKKKCHDCGVSPGELHSPGCDTERCPCCFRQLISCGCCDVFHPNWSEKEDEEGKYWWPPDDIRLPWTGIMYEKEEEVAIKDNKFVRWEDGWKDCDKKHPDAMPDVNYGTIKVRKKCPHAK